MTEIMKARYHHIIMTLATFLALTCPARLPGSSISPAATTPPPALKVKTDRVILRDAPFLQELPATVRPSDRSILAAKVMGVIVSLPVTLGQTVRQGQELVAISAQEIAARVEQARAAERQAARDLERETGLLAQNAATPESVRNLEDRLQMARAALLEAETYLSYTKVLAPYDGVIVRKSAHEGDLATPGMPLLEIERQGALRLEVEVPEVLARRLQPGREVEARLEEQVVTVKLAEMSASADPRSRTVLTKFDLPADAPARSGMFARVLLPAGKSRQVLVPLSAVTSFGQMERVFVVEDGRARLRLVRTGARQQPAADGATTARVEILSGLRGGETVIVEPSPILTDGYPVEIVP